MAVHDLHRLTRRAEHVDVTKGVVPADGINNVAVQVVIALIGTGMVLAGIWFFFIHPNGGFVWREGDWEDYKSTVLRRKGPDGRTLSNATKSTKLGGGSVVHGGTYTGGTSVGYTDETGTSADMQEMREAEAGQAGAFGLRGGEERKKRRHRSDHHKNEYKDPELREYRHEKPARVGGLNRQADGIYADYSNTEPSEVTSNVSHQPLIKDKDSRKKDSKKKEDDKKEAKAKERRAKERMREAQRKQKEDEKAAAAAAKAAKSAEKEKAKREKEEKKRHKKHRKDNETEATPSEYPATEYPATEYPATEYAATESGPSQGLLAKDAQTPPRRSAPSAAYSFTTGDDNATVYTTPYTAPYTDNHADDRSVAYTATQTVTSDAQESSYYSDYRPKAEVKPTAFTRSASRPRGAREQRSKSHHRSSESRGERSSRPSSRPTSRPASTVDTFRHPGEETGTKAYPCHIPGLSSDIGSIGVSESISQVGGPTSGRRGRDVMDGYRRAGAVRVVGRRDSLSDSD